MPRIPDDELTRIKRSTDLLSLIRSSGVELSRHGQDWLGLCPHHDDHEPSLVVSPGKNLWNCLGACRTGGGPIDWVMKTEKVGFRAAVEILRKRLGETPPRSSSLPTSRPTPEPTTAPDRLLSRVAEAYRGAYLASPEAQQYATSRGIGDPATAEHFGYGYADRSLAKRLDLGRGAEGRALREQLKALGVLRASGHEHLAGCLVFPILGAAGDVSGFYGRRIREAPKAPKHLYLPGPREGLLSWQDLENAEELILCESAIDAATFWSHGFRNTTCSWGVNGFTSTHLEAFRQHSIRHVLIAYDRDAAGDTAAQELGERLAQEGVSTSRVLFPKGLDANSYAAKVQPARKALETVIASVQPLAGPRATTVDVVPSEPPPLPAAKKEKEEASSSLAAPPAQPEPATHDPIHQAYGDRRWRVRGLAKNLSFERLKVLLRVCHGEAVFTDSVDLVVAKQRATYLRQAAEELETKEEVLKRDLGKLHLHLEGLQETLIERELAPKEQEAPTLGPEAEQAALAYLRRPDLLEAILEDFRNCGVVGEETNKLVGYLAAISRKLAEPLAVVLQSSSAAGKTSLMDAVLAFVPEEERVQYSAMTGQSLFYMGETELAHKILALVEEEGAERASYALKLLQSEGELTIASTGKDPESGRLTTHEYHVEGPVMLFLTTTAIDLDEELLNRCLVLTVDESREQTRAIHRLQRERRTLEGLLGRRRKSEVLELHRNAQRLLAPLPVVNPFARKLTFLDTQTRARRDHEKYLTLIEAITLLHQHQRPRKRAQDRGQDVEYLEVTHQDLRVANRLAGEVLGRSLDELPPQTRTFLEDLGELVSEACQRLEMEQTDLRFTRRQVADALGRSYFQVRKHLDRLVELEYVLAHRGARGQRFVYELLYDGQGRGGRSFLTHLIDVEGLDEEAESCTSSESLSPSDESLSPPEGKFEPPLSPHCAPFEPRLSPERIAAEARNDGHLIAFPAESPENALLGIEKSADSHERTARRAAIAGDPGEDA